MLGNVTSSAQLIGPLPTIYIDNFIIEYKATSESYLGSKPPEIEPPEEIQVSTQTGVQVFLH